MAVRIACASGSIPARLSVWSGISGSMRRMGAAGPTAIPPEAPRPETLRLSVIALVLVEIALDQMSQRCDRLVTSASLRSYPQYRTLAYLRADDLDDALAVQPCAASVDLDFNRAWKGFGQAGKRDR